MATLRLRQKYPDRVAVVITVTPPLLPLKHAKFLVPKNLTVAEFMLVVRAKLAPNPPLQPEQTLFLMCSNVMCPMTELVSVLDAQYATTDGVLNLTLAIENTFGGLIHRHTHSSSALCT